MAMTRTNTSRFFEGGTGRGPRHLEKNPDLPGPLQAAATGTTPQEDL